MEKLEEAGHPTQASTRGSWAFMMGAGVPGTGVLSWGTHGRKSGQDNALPQWKGESKGEEMPTSIHDTAHATQHIQHDTYSTQFI